MSRMRWIMIYFLLLGIGAAVSWFSYILVNHDMACKQDTYLTPHADSADCK